MHRQEPMGLSDWANKNFYLSSESSYVEGRWETLPFQIFIMNVISNDQIRVVNWIKSARVGYTKVVVAAAGYFQEHKARNQIVYQPTDGQAAKFMKAHIESMIRDVPCVKALAPWYSKKHRDNTLDTKRFSNNKNLWVLGAASAKNFREKSPDIVIYDELSSFASDVEKEGDPLFLGDKRIEGSVFPKSIRGSTPKTLGTCLITIAASKAQSFFNFYLPCPHCDEEQILEFGGKDTDYGIKWTNNDPDTAAYLCKHCHSLIDNSKLMGMQKRALKAGEPGAFRSTCGAWSKDGKNFYRGDSIISPPVSISYHIWTAYYPLVRWSRIVSDFLSCKGDPSAMRSFVNTTLGETWDESEGEKLNNDILFTRREHYKAEVPVDHCVLVGSVDVQDDRLEIYIKAWVSDEESYAISYDRLYGDLSRPEIWNLLYLKLTKTYKTPSGLILEPKISCIDSGGHYTDEVYNFCRRHGPRKFVPIKGRSKMGRELAVWPRKPNSKGVYLVMVGTDTGKDIVYDRLSSSVPGAGYMHYPVSEQFDETFFQQLVNERKIKKYVKGKMVYMYDAGGRRNEPLDLENYNLVGIRLLQQYFGVDLNKISTSSADKKQNKPKKSSFL